jgi:hypothetical protein
MKKINSTKSELLAAFDKSENKQVAEVCRIVGVTSGTFYFHFYKDSEFRREVFEKRREHLAERIANV